MFRLHVMLYQEASGQFITVNQYLHIDMNSRTIDLYTHVMNTYKKSTQRLY